jgi:hypothetical protein
VDDARRTTHGQRLRAKGAGGWARCRVQGARCRVHGSRFHVRSSKFDIRYSIFDIQNFRFKVPGAGCWVLGTWCRFQVPCSRFEVRCSTFKIPGQLIMKSQFTAGSLRVTRSGTKQSHVVSGMLIRRYRNTAAHSLFNYYSRFFIFNNQH